MTKVTKLACVNRGGPLRQGAKAERPTQTTEPNARVEISPTGTSLCGVVVWIGRCPAEPDHAAMRAVATCIYPPRWSAHAAKFIRTRWPERRSTSGACVVSRDGSSRSRRRPAGVTCSYRDGASPHYDDVDQVVCRHAEGSP